MCVIIFYLTGERLSLLVLRTAPGLGNVTVDWTIQGLLVHRTFTQTSGTLFFTEVNNRLVFYGRIKVKRVYLFNDHIIGACVSQGELNDTIVLQLLDDATPENKEQYKVSLSNIQTFGNELLVVSFWLLIMWDAFVCPTITHPHGLNQIDFYTGVVVTGHAALDVQGRDALLTVDTSDKPYGLLTIAPASLRVTTEEREQIINIYINREFGVSGQWFNYSLKKA